MIKVDSMAVFNGQADEFLLRAPFNDCSLPLARTLMFSFGLWQLEYAKRVLDSLDPAETRANIRAFVGRVKQMAPRANEIRLELVMELAEPPNIVKKYFGSLATQLYQLVDWVELRSYSSLARMGLQLHKVRDLVHIKSRDYDEAFASLVRRSASTLQSLNIRICRSGNIAGVIRDESRVYVQYPQLHKLKLDTFIIPEDMTEQVFPGAMPFPKLRHITLDGQYPLGDEAIFRGNAATLEYLSLMISPEKLVLFRERRVFTPTSHPNLRYVRIFQPADVTPNDLNILAVNMDFVLGIGPNALLREVTNIPYRAGIPRMLSLDRNRSCLQYLLLYGTRLDLAQVIILMVNLPIGVDVQTIYKGQALQLLSTKPYGGCAFQQARKLTFDLDTKSDWDEYDEDFPPDTEANILAFTQRIKEMAPRVSKVYVGVMDMNDELVTSFGKHIRFLLSNLYMLTDTTPLTNGCARLMECLNLVPVCKLACIDYNIAKDTSLVLRLARFNAPTLQAINIRSSRVLNISGLIRDPDGGKYMEYPYVRSLTMQLGSVSVASPRPTFKGAVPFLGLRCLVLNSDYPFGDDVLFRGNATILEYLRLCLTAEIVTFLTKCNAFMPTSHPKLLRASVRRIAGHELMDKVIRQNISLLGKSGSIHYAYQVAPAFIRFAHWASNYRRGPQGVKAERLPDYVRATYAPMGKRFRCWHISSREYTKWSATSVLLLALICPNFSHVAMKSSHRKAFTEVMEWQLAMPEFEAYARHLRYQLYGNTKRIK
ncbi:hypothetical protein GGH94_000220 [Coemansia aciculifera]|uniref:Uncharacterized protein n=1 Tax=Coemansia aciculifera TaxID=417176 RepID=A0A9W8M819_9FUNG|nr:hypothetical protein GGH94_000220 [Coemansia aciculifera]